MINLTSSNALWSAFGMLAGGGWNFANLWILSRLLSAWMAPARSKRRVLGWLFLKLAVLYPLVFLFLQRAPHLAISFGIGFTIVLGAAIGYFAVAAQRPLILKPHGR